MKLPFRAPQLFLVLLSLMPMVGQSFAQTNPPTVPQLQALVNSAVQAALQQFADRKLQSNQLAVTLVDLRDPAKPLQAAYRGDAPI